MFLIYISYNIIFITKKILRYSYICKPPNYMNLNPSSYVAVYDVSEFALIILVIKPKSEVSYLFTIHKLSGALDFSGIKNNSIFDSRVEAEMYIANSYNILSPKYTGIALIGYAHTGSKLSIILVTEAVPVAYFMNQHVIFQIKASKNITLDIPLFPPEILGNEISQNLMNQIETFPLAELHMWCETKDITSPIGFTKYQKEKKQTIETTKENIKNEKNNENENTNENEKEIPKNEFVWNDYLASPFAAYGQRDACITLLEGTAISQIMMINNEPIRFSIITVRSSAHAGTRYHTRGLNSEAFPANEVQCEIIIENSKGEARSHFWRRGTVPVQWRTVQSKALPTASLEVENNCDENTPLYFKRLREEYSFYKHQNENPKETCKQDPKIVCVNLLHNNESNSEFKLCTAYKKAVSSEKNVSYFEFDWHHNKKELGLNKCIETYWGYIFKTLNIPKFTLSKIEKDVDKCSKIIPNSLLFANDSELNSIPFITIQRQDSFIRVNCMDSLDRTNVGCFFYCVYSLIHNFNRTESIPTYDQLMSLEEELRVFLANAFIAIGDTVSFLYTNTPACMTTTFSQLAGIENKTASDSSIAMQRRYQNFLKDKTRQKSIDSFLGLKFEKHSDLFCVSTFPASFLHPLPGNCSPDNSKLDGILSYKPSTMTFNIGGNSKTIQTIIYLSHPSYIHSLVINIVPPFSPSMVSIDSGLLISNLNNLCSNFAIPKITSPSPCIIRIPPDYCNGNNNLSRILRLTFSTSCNDSKMTISNIFVFGTIKTENPSFTIQKQIYNNLVEVNNDEKWPRISDTSSLKTSIARLKDLSPDSIISVELTRLHHCHSKLETASLLAANGFDPFEYSFNKFRGLMKNVVNSNNSIPENNTNNMGNNNIPVITKTCSICNTQSTIINTIQESSFLFDDLSSNLNADNTLHVLCKCCFDKYNNLTNGLLNVKRFYNGFWKLHDQTETDFHNLYLECANNTLISNINSFPLTSFILCEDPEQNLILTDKGGRVESPSHFQIAFGAKCLINTMTIDGNENCNVTIQSTTGGKQINAKNGKINIDIIDHVFTVFVNDGILNKLKFDVTPNVRQLENEYEAGTWKFTELLIAKKIFVSSESSFIFKLTKPTPVSGLLFEKMNGINSIIVLFFDGNNEKSSGYEFYHLPFGIHDFSIYFQTKRTTQSVKIIFYDADPAFQLSKIGIF
ncbi:SacI like proteiny domain containing protein [Tritrichomonas foetus]|uniref:SacI like proteiny domain containing protein n=1 Tax=Tritrichomonas foetus TaxID=1144522 RepID=A0A1J4JBG7_9EUKA|nr:SacI like proteiny domain containing protein [Tritrichomonas foetus]|eukprot:OHS94781.1 SacI like proteiny domain containing protein [Tritrichomonas foetus]